MMKACVCACAWHIVGLITSLISVRWRKSCPGIKAFFQALLVCARLCGDKEKWVIVTGRTVFISNVFPGARPSHWVVWLNRSGEERRGEERSGVEWSGVAPQDAGGVKTQVGASLPSLFHCHQDRSACSLSQWAARLHWSR